MSDDSSGPKMTPPYMGVVFWTRQDMKPGKKRPETVLRLNFGFRYFSKVINNQHVDNFQPF